MTSIPCNIVLIPDIEIAEKLTFLSEELSAEATYFTLKEGEYYPHASLYMVQLDMDRIEEINNLLSNIAAITPKISSSPKEYHQEWGYIGVEFQRDAAIDKLQMDIVLAINPLRDGLRQKDKDRLADAIGKERENIETYGYRSVGAMFAPHITITRFSDHKDINLNRLPDVSQFLATFSKIGIFEMGENGTCIRKIAEFGLQIS